MQLSRAIYDGCDSVRERLFLSKRGACYACGGFVPVKWNLKRGNGKFAPPVWSGTSLQPFQRGVLTWTCWLAVFERERQGNHGRRLHAEDLPPAGRRERAEPVSSCGRPAGRCLAHGVRAPRHQVARPH